MSSLRLVAFALLCACAACAKHRSPEAGTNTNWLKQCDADAECDGDGDCLCGVCTKACTARSECSALGSGVGCVGVDDAMCGQSATGSVCLPEQRPRSDGGPARDGGATDAGVTTSELQVTRTEGGNLLFPDEYRSCLVDADCTEIPTTCNCCAASTINQLLLSDYLATRDRLCRDYTGFPCSCPPDSTVRFPVCQNGLCFRRAYDSVRDCVSPTQNGERRPIIRDSGCPCEQVGLEFCFANTTGLICTEGPTGLVWSFDRTHCGQEHTSHECAPGSQRSTVDACLAEFERCFELPGDGFCGTGCHAPLDCVEQSCDPYQPFDPSMCEPTLFTWDGQCGGVRYRSQSGGLGGPTLYWDAETGELLARSMSTDTGAYCDGSSFEIAYGDFTVVNSCQPVINADKNPVCEQTN